MKRTFLSSCRRFSTKKVSDILGQSSTPKTKAKLSDLTGILAPRLRRPPKTLKQAHEQLKNVKNEEKLSPEERLVGAEMARAVSKVGEILGDGEQVKSDLLKKLIQVDRETYDLSKPGGGQESDFSSTLSNMTINKEEEEKTESIADQEKQFFHEIGLKLNMRRQKIVDKRPKFESSPKYDFVDFLKGDRLNLLDEFVGSAPEKPVLNPIWEEWRLKHSAWLTNVQPRNGFEEMIEWTENGRTYPYPIDNEYGFHEKFIPFQEHVFLNRRLENDDRVPKDGPVRQFLEAVCMGLSKNPYMKLERKKEHVEWYKDYFKDKIHLIEKMKENEDQLTE